MPRKARAKAKKDSLIVFIEWLSARPLLTELTLTAVTVAFGMQVLRLLIPGMFWTLGERMDLGAIQLGIIGFAIFLIGGFLAGPLSWLLGNRRLIAVTAAGLGLMRLFMQVSWYEPLFNLGLAILGTILFAIFLPACFEDSRLRGSPSVSRYALGLLGGMALDIAINGAFGTYDTIWQADLLPVLLTLLLLIIQMVLLMGIAPAITTTPTKSTITETSGPSIARSFTWLAIGPFLFLELVVFQNIPRVATLTGWPLSMAFGVTLIAQLAGLAVASWLLSKSWRMLWPWAFGAGVILTAAMVFAFQKPAALMALLFLVGQVLVSAIIAMVLVGITTSKGKTERSIVWVANGIGMVLFLLLIFAYYAVYDISLPYNNVILELIAGGIIAACAIGALIFGQQEVKADAKLWTVPIFALILLVLPLAQTITWQTPKAVYGEGFPIRVMTYNLHNGFNTKGKMDIEEIAQDIESNHPDIVALQEVSRGWVVSGRLDMLAWLSHRLQMPYVFGPTADAFWGNAILSRYPILAYSTQSLPPPELALQRGFIVALIDVGNDQQIKIIATHFDHIEGDSAIRQLQSQTIIGFWGGLDSTILLGDLNAGGRDPEIVMLSRAFLRDAAARLEARLAYTFPSDNPHEVIDYIFTSFDLTTRDVNVPPTTASDHRPVVAVIYK